MKGALVLIGGGGHCRSCIDVIEQQGNFSIAGIIDLPDQLGKKTLGYPVIGTDEDLAELITEDYSFLITIGQIKDGSRRQQLFNKLFSTGAHLPTVISPRAYLSPHAKVGPGTIIMHGAIINVNAAIAANCIINSQSLIEHDAVVEDHCHISTGAIINGGAHIGAGSFVGSQAMVREGVKIGAGAVIGAGTVILRDVEARSTIRAQV